MSVREKNKVLTCFSIADIGLALISGHLEKPLLSEELSIFSSASVTAPDIEVNVEWIDKINHSFEAPLFDSGGVWTLFREGPNFRFDFCSPMLGPASYKCLFVNESFTEAELMLSREALSYARPIFPLEYPADELLFTNYLAAHGLGVEVHGCGLVDAETGGHLLLGHSGAGKSTTARLWQSLRNPEILSDDRIIIRIENGELWMYGTPWHGEGQFASPGKARLNHILILQHGERNQVVEMSRSLAVGELFARCFPPFHSPEGLQHTLDFLQRVVNIAPVCEFRFVPDAAAVETAIRMKHAAAA